MIGLAVRSAILQPRRFLGALSATVAVAASAVTVQALAPAGDPPLLALVYGGIAAFNVLLLFPPGSVAGRPLRILAVLLANAVPLALSPLLYQVSFVLADAVLILAAAASVLVRPLVPPASSLGLMVALNLLIPLVLGGEIWLAWLGVITAVVGSAFGTLADAVVAVLLRAPAAGFEQQLLRDELAGFLADLARLWRSGDPIWPASRLSKRIGRVRTLRDEVMPASPAGPVSLPPDAMLEGVGRSAALLREHSVTMSATDEDAVGTALAALASAARHGRDDDALAAIAALRQAALRHPGPDQPAPPARMLGFALLLSDLVEAAWPQAPARPA